MVAYEYEGLSKEIEKVVKNYFYNFEYGTESFCITYNSWNIKKYSFSIYSSTYNYGVRMLLKGDTDINAFKKEVKAILKNNGFTKVSFIIKKNIIKGGAFGDYETKQLVGIDFDK